MIVYRYKSQEDVEEAKRLKGKIQPLADEISKLKTQAGKTKGKERRNLRAKIKTRDKRRSALTDQLPERVIDPQATFESLLEQFHGLEADWVKVKAQFVKKVMEDPTNAIYWSGADIVEAQAQYKLWDILRKSFERVKVSTCQEMLDEVERVFEKRRERLVGQASWIESGYLFRIATRSHKASGEAGVLSYMSSSWSNFRWFMSSLWRAVEEIKANDQANDD